MIFYIIRFIVVIIIIAGGVPYWDFVGSTIVTNKFIRLTSDSQSLAGGLWNAVVSFIFFCF
jgi:hypothetical protein